MPVLAPVPLPVLVPEPVPPTLLELVPVLAWSRRQLSFAVPLSRLQSCVLELEPVADEGELDEDDGLLEEPIEDEPEPVVDEPVPIEDEPEPVVDEPVPVLDEPEPVVEGELMPLPELPELPLVCASAMLPRLRSAAATAAPNTFIFILMLL